MTEDAAPQAVLPHKFRLLFFIPLQKMLVLETVHPYQFRFLLLVSFSQVTKVRPVLLTRLAVAQTSSSQIRH